MSRRWFLSLPLLLLVGFAVPPAARGAAPDPRHFDATALGGRVDLGKQWLFAPDDQPAYAGVTVDDNRWRVVSTDRALVSYGYQNLPYCWYRLHARLRPDARKLAVLVGGVAGAYEVYANGVRVGGVGNMAAHSMQQQGGLFAYPVPDQAIAASPRELVLAIRFSNQIRRYQIRTMDNPLIQASVFLESQDAASRDTSYNATHNEEITFLLGSLNLLIGLVALALYLALRSRQEYLAIGILCLAASADACVATWEYLGTFSVWKITLSNCFEALQPLAIIEFVRLILGARRTRMWLIIEVLAMLGPVINPVASIGIAPVSIVFAAYFVSLLIMDVVLPVLLLRAWWRGNTDARVLLPAILLGIFSDYYQFVRQVVYYFHVFHVGDPWSLSVGSYHASVSDLGGFAFSITILLFLVLRTIHIARDRARIASEIEAAQTVQQVLLARASVPTPGFTVESVYYPAGEVGGDFFLVSPGPDGSLIAIVGDVSGKGLIAAMRVSMILGVLRREDSRRPAVILDQLNEALLTQGEMGFTTACCVRLEPDGLYTVANAGHISPYSEGVEVATPPSLPLGLAGHAEYETISGVLTSGQKLVLMSDGVVEARSAEGELYGFDRLPGLTRMPAADIADIARRFGQDDDITVLTIACSLESAGGAVSAWDPHPNLVQ